MCSGKKMAFFPESISVNPMSLRPNTITTEQDIHHGSLPIKVEHNSPNMKMSINSLNSSVHLQPGHENISNQNVAFNGLSINDIDDKVSTLSYTNMTAWTTKLTNQGQDAMLQPAAGKSLSVPLTMSSLQPCFPVAADPIHLTSRTQKASPYHNAFSVMHPLQHKPAKLPKMFQGGHPNTMAAAVSPMNSDAAVKLKLLPSKENRFKRTAEALHKSGLWEIAMKTGNLIKRNQELQRELEQFKMDALNFLKSVIKNPKNRDFIKTVLNNALSAGAATTEHKRSSVMTVVVSAAAAAAANSEHSSMTESSVCTSSQSISSNHGSSVTGSNSNCETSVTSIPMVDSDV